ncbi:tRNA A37 threonylcarbamoyltransferase TsaD [Evansella vedderi]|uniref:tRNA A37 threonylcarbamoyltransferase TsaD n=1 Tax=Evansella vedderi TaxID=38282 RepID=A0ABU0A487_9BACI|nr:YycC family protein [Evansella vedderi]MDQ0257786.1 tRNA A37 threonylcarbamoyltransferase TsaD [Evansella vedderi]
MKPNQISLETAQMLAKKLKMPLEHVMHTPPHILMAKLKQLEEKEEGTGEKQEDK